MMGVHHPVASMEHQYLVTEEIPAIRDAGHRMPLLRCPISDYYSRQEKNGLVELTDGRSLEANIALVLNNAALASRIATEIAQHATEAP